MSSLSHDVLALLLDGPSSVAALYGALMHDCDYPRDLSVSEVLAALGELEHGGWATAYQMEMDGAGGYHEPTDEERDADRAAYIQWLSGGAEQDFALDEIGLWYWVTDEGRSECQRWFQGATRSPSSVWMLDDSAEEQTITVHAEGPQEADAAIRQWLSSQPGVELIDGVPTLEPVDRFQTRGGNVVVNGVRAKYRYRKRSLSQR